MIIKKDQTEKLINSITLDTQEEIDEFFCIIS